MVQKRLLQRSAGAVALGAVVLGAAGFSAARTTPQTRPGALPQASYTPHVLNYPNIDPKSLFPNTFDPANVTDSQSIMVINMIYGNLVKLNSQNQVIPDLATYSVSPNRLVYTFHLRNTKFSDGKQVTADDAIYSIDRALNPKVYQGAASPVASLYMGHILGVSSYKGVGQLQGLKKINSSTVQITLDSPISFFLQSLTYPTADILEQGKTPLNGLVTKNPTQNQISSGPWKISKYSVRSSLTFVPNTGYYDYGKMKLKQIFMPFVGDTDTLYAGYTSGQYEFGQVPSKHVTTDKSLPDFHTSPILSIDYISYNSAKLPFSNKNMRLAMSYAIDRDTINNNVLHGTQKTIYSVVPQGILGYDESGKNYVPSYNPAKAKMYLALAKKQLGSNFPTASSPLTIRYQNTNQDINNEYTVLQSEWKAIGVPVKIQGVDFNTWLGLVAKPTGKEQWVENLWIDDYPDAQDFTTNLLTPASAYNIGNYDSAAFNTLTNKALTATGSARAQLYVQASRVALNDGAWSMIGQQTENWRWDTSHIKGMDLWTSTANPYPLNNDWTNVDVQ